MLTLSEELYLALHYSEKEGGIVPLEDSTAHLIVAGGVTAELFLLGRVQLNESELVVTDGSPTGDDLLSEALYRLHPAVSFEADSAEWFYPIAEKLLLGRHMLARLEEKDVLRSVKKQKWFGLSSSTVYKLQDSAVPQRWHDLQMEVLVNGRAPSIHEAVLLFMTEAWGYPLPAALSRSERKAANKRWQALFGDYWGIYPDEPTEPIPNLHPAVRDALGNMIVSWATIQANFVAEDVSSYLQYYFRSN